jgi:hypothetical protein
MSGTTRLLAAAALLALFATPSLAQMPAAATPASPAFTSPTLTSSTLTGPTLTGASAAVRYVPASHPSPVDPTLAANSALAKRSRSGLQHSQVLMIVGGAAILTGLIAGGDAQPVLVIAGAAIGLWGLYRFLE